MTDHAKNIRQEYFTKEQIAEEVKLFEAAGIDYGARWGSPESNFALKTYTRKVSRVGQSFPLTRKERGDIFLAAHEARIAETLKTLEIA